MFHLDTNDRFDELGVRKALFNEGGRSVTTSFYLTAAYGLYRGLDMWVELPMHRLAYDDIAAKRRSTGIGDPRIFVRMSPALLGWSEALPIALRGG